MRPAAPFSTPPWSGWSTARTAAGPSAGGAPATHVCRSTSASTPPAGWCCCCTTRRRRMATRRYPATRLTTSCRYWARRTCAFQTIPLYSYDTSGWNSQSQWAVVSVCFRGVYFCIGKMFFGPSGFFDAALKKKCIQSFGQRGSPKSVAKRLKMTGVNKGEESWIHIVTNSLCCFTDVSIQISGKAKFKWPEMYIFDWSG